MTNFIMHRINLQLFAEGAAEGGGTDSGATTADSTLATSQKGVKNPLANVKYGKQAEVQTADAQEQSAEPEKKAAPLDRNAEFESLIKGDFKDLYDKRVQETIQRRLKSTKDTVDRYNALSPVLDMLAQRYDVDVTDVNALSKAIEDDNALYEQEAVDKGIPIEQLKAMRKMERENSMLRRQMQEQDAKEQAYRQYSSWLQQAETTKTVYPGFDLDSELQNQRFVDLLRSNIDVRTAYEVLHKDEIIPAAMQFTAERMGEQYANKVIAGGSRPTENGTAGQSSAVVKSDVSQLTKKDREEIIRRVQRGEKISF